MTPGHSPRWLVSAAPLAALLFASACTHTTTTTTVPVHVDDAAHFALGASTQIVLADAPRGVALLQTHDAYLAAMTPLDRAIRLHGATPDDEAAMIAAIAREVRAFSAQEAEIVRRVITSIARELARLGLSLPLPAVIEIVKTTGREEIDPPGGIAYTREQTIVLSAGAVAGDIESVLRHELFHVLTRNAPELRDALYGVIGYRPIAAVTLPDALESMRLTNPDSPIAQHVIRVRVAGSEVWVANVLLGSRPYDGGSLFTYLEPRLVPVDDAGHVVVDASGEAHTYALDEVEGYAEQIGSNTHYVIQPEEVLADNFILVLRGDRDVPSPDVPDRMLAVLRGAP